ncbi:MAG TPA: acyl-CoA dehydrogenase family protein [Gemmatimonadota bacterium]|nr:acyl-CoA dehydrogenase family protein [Gemmatimonadota bacterium]
MAERGLSGGVRNVAPDGAATGAPAAEPRSAELPSFCKSLFSGVIAADLVFPYPTPTATEAEVLEPFLEDLRRFLDAKVDGAAFDREANLPEGVLEGLAERGVLGLSIPTRYGGLGFTQFQTARVMELIAERDSGLGVVLGSHLSIGLRGIHLYGTEEQKRRWLPPCARGETLAAFALTEPGYGSDAAHIESRALRPPGGDGWILNGHKIWIGNAHRAGVITTFAQTPVEKGDRVVDRVTAFVLDGDQEGIEIGRVWTGEKLGIRSSTQAELFYRDVHVADDQVLDRPGHGFKIAMNVLNGGRLGLAASAVGGVGTVLVSALDFAVTRRQFGRPIVEFDLIAGKIARMRIEKYVAEAMVYLTAGLFDRGDVDTSLESAICKVYASEMVWRAADDALQIAGGRGYMRDRPFERYLRDARIMPIFEGTNEVLRAFIALAGMERLGDYLEDVGHALREPIKEIGFLTEFAFHRIRDAIGSRHAAVDVAQPLAGCLRYFERFTGFLHDGAESLLRAHKEGIVNEQFQLARLADMAIDLYGLAAVISRAQASIERRGEEAAEPEIDIVRQFCREAGARIERNRALLSENRDARLRRIVRREVAEREVAERSSGEPAR